MAFNIPVGQPDIELAADPADSAQRVAEAASAFETAQIEATAYVAQIKAIAAQAPTSLAAWAALGELTLPDDVVTAYAFFRTGYHRGLDRARASGWNGSQPLPWALEGNRGFLRCLYGLMQAAQTIGETSESMRIHHFLLELDPSNHFGLDLL